MQSTLSDAEGNILYRATLTYDGQNRLESFRERAGEETHRTEFHYDKDSRVTQMDYDTDKGKVEYSYDSLGRIVTRKVTNGTSAYETAYTFVEGASEYGENATTPLDREHRTGRRRERDALFVQLRQPWEHRIGDAERSVHDVQLRRAGAADPGKRPERRDGGRERNDMGIQLRPAAETFSRNRTMSTRPERRERRSTASNIRTRTTTGRTS